MLPMFAIASRHLNPSVRRKQFLMISRLKVSLVPALLLSVALMYRGQVGWVQTTGWQDFFALATLLSGRGGLVLLVMCAGSLVLALVRLIGLSERAGRQAVWGEALVWMWLVLPVAMTTVISLFKPMLVSRYFIFCLPAFVLLVATGLSTIRPKWLLAPVLLVIVALSLRGVAEYYRSGFDPPEQDWRGAVQYMLSRTEPGDAVLFYHPLARLAYEYYRERWPQYPAPVAVFPPRGDARLLKGTQLDFALLPQLPKRYQRLWVVQNWGPDPFTARMQSIFAANYTKASERDFSIIHVMLYQRALPK